MRKRAASGVEGHGRLGIERAERFGQIHRSGKPQREDHGLSFRFGLGVSIQRLDEFSHLPEDGLVRCDHKRIGCGIRFDPDRLFTTQVIGPGVVPRGQQPGNLRGVAGRKLQHPERRHVSRLKDVEFANERFDRFDLGGVTSDPQTIGWCDDFNGRRRDHSTVTDLNRRFDHGPKWCQNLRSLGLPNRDHPTHRGWRKQSPCFRQGTFESLHRFRRSHHLEDARGGIDRDFGLWQVARGEKARLSIKRRHRPFQQNGGVTGTEGNHAVRHISRLWTI